MDIFFPSASMWSDRGKVCYSQAAFRPGADDLPISRLHTEANTAESGTTGRIRVSTLHAVKNPYITYSQPSMHVDPLYT